MLCDISFRRACSRRYFWNTVFFDMIGYGFGIIEQRKPGPFREIRYRTIGDKRKTRNRARVRALSRPLFRNKRKTHDTEYIHNTYTHVYVKRAYIYTHTHGYMLMYTAYKMNARRHTLDSDRTTRNSRLTFFDDLSLLRSGYLVFPAGI